MSPLGADFPQERFLRTPIATIRWVLRQIDDHEKAAANIASVTTAQLTQVVIEVAHSFSQSRGAGPTTKAQQFMPFPDWKPEGETKQQLDQTTKTVLAKLLKRGQIPIHVFAALSTTPEQPA
jgi:hypothetical protein